MVFMSVLALSAVIENKKDLNDKTIKQSNNRAINIALYISAGITVLTILIGLLICGGFSYSGTADEQMAAQYGNQWARIQEIFIQDRKALFVRDSWRSLIFVVLAFGLLWLYINNKLKKTWILLAPLALLITIDLWGVDRRYISKDSFVKARNLDFKPAPYDTEIDRLAAQNGDKDYRVLNLAVNTFNDAKPSVFHHQIGGYSAVKLRRYQDIIDFYISRRINPQVLAMLNARYIVTGDGQVHRNPDALGNAWFVDDYKLVPDPNAEILALNDIDPAATAIIDSSQWASVVKGYTIDVSDSTASIVEDYQEPYNPGYLKYNSHCATDRLAVFSEVFYKPDWFAYVDGKPAEYFRVNYILRAMIVPAGDHTIEFRNEAPLVHKLDMLTLISQIVLLVIIGGVTFFWYRNNRKRAKENIKDC